MNTGRSPGTKVLIGVTDVFLVSVALYVSYSIRFDFQIWPFYQEQLWNLLPIFVLVRLALVYYSGGYGFIWRYASITDLLKVARAVALGSAFLAVINYFRNYPVGLLLAGGLFLSVLAHRGTIHLRARRARRTLGLVLIAAALCTLVAGVLAFTVLSSAPATIQALPLGHLIVQRDFQHQLNMPRSVLVLEAILSFLLLTGARLSPRLLLLLRAGSNHQGRRVLIYGAGDVGENLVRLLKGQPSLGCFPTGFIDDDDSKQRVSIHGVRVLGGVGDLERLIDRLRIKELLVAIPALTGSGLREVASVCWKKGVIVRRVPPLSRMIDSRHGIESLEEVDIQDLLGRVEVDLDPERVVAYLRDRVVLVTGAGGSIGAELCRQIARCRPKRLLLLGKGENSIYEIEKELTAAFHDLEVAALIGDICNVSRVDYLFERHAPDVVFHAAAHKHVPFMEEAPDESVRNNVFGTQTVARMALKHGVAKFVLISSDKAVHPSSVMGATKRLAELVVQKLSGAGPTGFITVRFGNVLRSRGSVIPLFERQIKSGGPVTITHAEMTRYFMSIPEAVRLVLHAGAIGDSGDLCILDMGKPVRIVELAENLITLAGRKPYEEVDIVFTGIRPGEKLSEELMTEEEAATTRHVDRIVICTSVCRDWDVFDRQLERLAAATATCRGEEVIGALGEILPEYTRTDARPR